MEKEITNLLNEIAEKLKEEESREKWTCEIKQGLTALGEKHNYQITPDLEKRRQIKLHKDKPPQDKPPQDKSHREWLYDLTWRRLKNGGPNDVTSIELAVECEWRTKLENLEIDFLKLVYAKARLKLFIFKARTRADYESKLKRLKELADMCEDKNHDKYLFSCTVKEAEGKFIHESYTAT